MMANTVLEMNKSDTQELLVVTIGVEHMEESNEL